MQKKVESGADLDHNTNNRDTTRYPFQSFYSCCRFYKNNNPARQKSGNLFDKETKGIQSSRDVFKELQHERLWARVTLAIFEALKPYNKYQTAGFYCWYIDRDHGFDQETLAKHLGTTRDKLQKDLYKMKDSVQYLMRARKLIPEEED